MDAAVACAYGWGDLELEHDFHEVPYLPENDRVRFTISEAARVEVLRRLSALNRQRYKEEVARGLHSDVMPRASTRVPRANRTSSAAMSQSSLDLEAGTIVSVSGTTPTIADGKWGGAIIDVIAAGKVKRQGERRGARYCLELGLRDDHREGGA